MNRTLALALIAWCLAASGGAFAQSDDIALAVRARSTAAERCFEVTALRQRIAHYGEARLARASELRLELIVGTSDSAELLVYRGAELVSRREFERLPEACADRRDAVALSIALALDGVLRALEPSAAVERDATPESGRATQASEASAATSEPSGRGFTGEPAAANSGNAPESESESESDSEPEAEPEPAPSQTTITETQDTSSALPAPSVALHLGGRFLAGALPTPVWAGALGVQLWFGPHVGFDLSGLASTTGNSTLAGARAESRLIGGELLGCGALDLRDVEVQGCAGVILAACRASGRDYPVEFSASTLLWAAGAVRLAVRWPAEDRVSLRLAVQGHVNLVRPELRVQGASDTLHPSWLGGSAGVDVIVSLE